MTLKEQVMDFKVIKDGKHLLLVDGPKGWNLNEMSFKLVFVTPIT